MKASYSFTFKFGEIFENYVEFKEFTDSIEITTKNVEDDFNEFFFNLLWCKYFNRDVCFLTVDNFIRAFSVEYVNQYKFYKKLKSNIDKMYELTLEDLLSNGIVVNNLSGNDSANISNPFQPLNYIITQNSTKQELPKLDAYLKEINNLSDLWVNNILDKFGYLFMPFEVPTSVIY